MTRTRPPRVYELDFETCGTFISDEEPGNGGRELFDNPRRPAGAGWRLVGVERSLRDGAAGMHFYWERLKTARVVRRKGKK